MILRGKLLPSALAEGADFTVDALERSIRGYASDKGYAPPSLSDDEIARCFRIAEIDVRGPRALTFMLGYVVHLCRVRPRPELYALSRSLVGRLSPDAQQEWQDWVEQAKKNERRRLGGVARGAAA